MGEIMLYVGIGFVFLIGLYYSYKRVKRKIVIKKDYNRKISDQDLKVRKDLEVLRNQLLSSENPDINNEILNKIQAIVDAKNDRKGGYEK